MMGALSGTGVMLTDKKSSPWTSSWKKGLRNQVNMLGDSMQKLYAKYEKKHCEEFTPLFYAM